MPVYTYRREDGTEFDIRQKFSDDPLTVDPETGQKVQRIIQPAGIVFKGSGFYVNDSKGSKASLATPTNGNGNGNGTGKEESSTSSADSTTTTEPAAKKESTTTAEKTAKPASE